MNKDELEQEILLELSGELSASRKRRLARTLATSAEARAFRDETRRLTDLTRASLEEPGPSAAITARIMEEARRASRENAEPIHFLPRSVYAIAAVLVLGFSIWLTVHRPPGISTQVAEQPATTLSELPAWDDDIDTQLDELDELLLAMNTDSTSIFESSDELDTESLARELLLLEGEEI